MPIAASLRSSSPTMRNSPMNSRPRNIANDILDAVETATSKWTRQKKSEERHPGNIRYRASRMTREPRTTQKDAAWHRRQRFHTAISEISRLLQSGRSSKAMHRVTFARSGSHRRRVARPREIAASSMCADSQSRRRLLPSLLINEQAVEHFRAGGTSPTMAAVVRGGGQS
jgi:hypothetical protein